MVVISSVILDGISENFHSYAIMRYFKCMKYCQERTRTKARSTLFLATREIFPNMSDKNISVTIGQNFVHILKYPKLALLAN